MSGSDRRGFFRSLVSEVVRGREGLFDALTYAEELDELVADTVDGPAPPLAATHCATVDELADLATEVGLAARLDDVRRLAVTSVRLTAAEGGEAAGRSHHGAPADAHALQLDLADPALAGTPLPHAGVLRLTHADGEGAQVVTGELPDAPESPAGRRPLRLSAELVLPRVWTAPVQELELDGDEPDAWEELRARLAVLQGVEDPDAPPPLLERVLGYPEDRGADMPHPEWTLLLRLVFDEARRLVVWVPTEDLDAPDWANVRAIVR